MRQLGGTPSDRLPGVLATGRSDITYAFISLSAREPTGRDAEYLAWHSLDHRPEQHRLAGLRSSLRLVSTPACRERRAASAERFDGTDHVMTYLFTGPDRIPAFNDLGEALHRAGRMPLRLPTVEFLTADLHGKLAAPSAVAGADVIPWRPAAGVYLLIETGHAPVEDLVDVPGVAGAWWYHGNAGAEPYGSDGRGLQITYLYLEDGPVGLAGAIGERLRARWAAGPTTGLLAAPFHAVVPFDWDRYLP